jgi:hypothetical protein
MKWEKKKLKEQNETLKKTIIISGWNKLS